MRTSKNLMPHLGKLGQKLTTYHTKTKPAKTISSFMERHFAHIVKLVKTLCRLGQTNDFVLGIEVGNKYGMDIIHRVNGTSQIEFRAVRLVQQRQESFQEKVKFGKNDKHDFFKMIFFLLLKLPKSTTRSVRIFRIGRKIVLEVHPLEQSYQSILIASQPHLKETVKAPEVCKDFLKFGVVDNPITDYFNPRTREGSSS